MSGQSNISPSEERTVRDMPLWAGRYARNRSLPALLGLAIFLGGALVFSVLGRLVALAWHSGLTTLFYGALAVTVGAVGFWIWFCVGGSLEALIRRITELLYGSEGYAAPRGGSTEAVRRPMRIAGWGLALATLVMLIVVAFFDVPVVYWQPISTLFAVPFMVYVTYVKGRAASPLMLLWPALYLLHAVLLVAGVPIPYADSPAFTIALPIGVYGVVAALAGHLYSRYALRRLRQASQTAEVSGDDA